MQIAILPVRIPLKRHLSMCHPISESGVIIVRFGTESNRQADNSRGDIERIIEIDNI